MKEPVFHFLLLTLLGHCMPLTCGSKLCISSTLGHRVLIPSSRLLVGASSKYYVCQPPVVSRQPHACILFMATNDMVPVPAGVNSCICEPTGGCVHHARISTASIDLM